MSNKRHVVVYGLYAQVACAIGLTISLTLGVLWYAIYKQDEVIQHNYSELIERALYQKLDELVYLTNANSYWDESFQNLVDKIDLKWAENHLGHEFLKNNQLSELIVLNKDRELIYQYYNAPKPTPMLFPSDVIDPLFREEIDQLIVQVVRRQPETATSGSFIAHQGKLYALSIGVIYPDSYELSPPQSEKQAVYLVLIKGIDFSNIHQFVKYLGINNLTFTESIPPSTLKNGFAVLGNSGHQVGIIDWSFSFKGSNLFQESMPWIVVVLMIVAFIVWLIIKRGHRVISMLSDESSIRAMKREKLERQAQALKLLVQENLHGEKTGEGILKLATSVSCGALEASEATIWLLEEGGEKVNCHNRFLSSKGEHVLIFSPFQRPYLLS